MCELLEKLKTIRAEMLLITDRSNKYVGTVEGLTQEPLTVPAALASKSVIAEDLYTPIPYIIPAQLFAASLAEVKHLDPDRPRTLSKVTQTL
jgi:glucosamine--fructose-6-phosphate aminotransferase (isomerizing)